MARDTDQDHDGDHEREAPFPDGHGPAPFQGQRGQPEPRDPLSGDLAGDPNQPDATDPPAVDFDTFADWAEEIVANLPPQLLNELTGGIQIDRDARRRLDDPPGVYLLGEYITEPHLGRFIRIYYGSFVRTLAGEPASVWHDELEETILHELQHHVEALAGVDWLGIEDWRQLQELWREARRGLSADRGASPDTAGDARPKADRGDAAP